MTNSAWTSASHRGRTLRLVLAGGAVALAATMLGSTAANARPVDPKTPNAAAQKAGVERGNATMGWRDGVDRAVGRQSAGILGDSRVSAYAKITKAGKLVSMSGVLGIDVS